VVFFLAAMTIYLLILRQSAAVSEFSSTRLFTTLLPVTYVTNSFESVPSPDSGKHSLIFP
jgi:hypothetical protein